MFGSGKPNDQQLFVRILAFRRAYSVPLSHLGSLEVSSNLDSPTPNWLIWLVPTFSTTLPSIILNKNMNPKVILSLVQNAKTKIFLGVNLIKILRKVNSPRNRSQNTQFLENWWKIRSRRTPFSVPFRKRRSQVKVFLEVQRQINQNLKRNKLTKNPTLMQSKPPRGTRLSKIATHATIEWSTPKTSAGSATKI